MTATGPRIVELDTVESTAILARNRIGRLAFSAGEQVDIEPVSYVFADGVINIRTTPGAKLAALRHQNAVAFEVDEVSGPSSWRSVVIHGSVYMPDPEGSDSDRAAHAEALQQLRRAYAGALGPGDPWAFRDVVLRLHVHRIEGRAAVGG